MLGKLEGYPGQVTEVNYSFKIKLSDYKKVIAVIDTNVKGDFHLAGSHVVRFDRNATPFSKVFTWFKAPENDEDYVSGNDDAFRFSLDDLSKMKISHDVADRGHDYYIENRVSFVEIDGTCGHAIVEGSENYEIEFDYIWMICAALLATMQMKLLRKMKRQERKNDPSHSGKFQKNLLKKM